MRACLLAILLCLACAAPAGAATVSVNSSTLRVTALPGEPNAITVITEDALEGPQLVVTDPGAPLSAGAGCLPGLTPDRVTCAAAAVASVSVSAGDLDDSVEIFTELPARLTGGDGDDQLRAGGGNDRLNGGRGEDWPYCGEGRDTVRGEVKDSPDFSCERVSYGRAGRIAGLRSLTGGGRFVEIPGQGGARIDRRILKSVLYLVRRYRIRIGDGLAVRGHNARGEHPLGLAVDIVPGPGGSWRQIDRLAKWAEPRQNRPRAPFRWVGYNGDRNHGRGDHLHLSWQHSPGRRGRPVRKLWTWIVRR